MLYPFADYWWAYGGFTLFVIVVLVVDLGIFHRRPHVMKFREAATWCVVWPVLALLFCLALWIYSGWRFPQAEEASPGLLKAAGFDSASTAANTLALQFLAGYVVEQSLSVDNIFVFVVIFRFFAVPAHLQHRVLFYGIIGAVAFRAVFIALGAVLLQYKWVIWVFGGFLVLTGIKLMISRETEKDLSKNWVVRLARRMLPVTPQYHGAHFFLREPIGAGASAAGAPSSAGASAAGVTRLVATPLFLALVVVEATDVVFAVDSVPAIFAITREPLIVFTSNIFAILGLRALYFLLAGAMDSFHLLKYGLGIVLIFVGLKMAVLNEWFDGHFPITWSLGIICGVIGGSIAASLLLPKTPAVRPQ
ncbi:MAG: TerC family protein [Phycisphaerae bacterium]|nr:TerC family protein [Phycisphaerae bacterium]